MTDLVVLGVTFEEEGVTISWALPNQDDRFGMEVHQAIIPGGVTKLDEHVKYWYDEMMQSITEFVYAWMKARSGR